MDVSSLLPTSVLLLILTSPIIYIIGRKLKEKTGYITSAIIFISLAMLLAVTREYYTTGKPIEFIWKWIPLMKIKFGFKADGLSIAVSFIILLLSAATAIYSVVYMEHKPAVEAYFLLYLLYVAGMYGTILATNLIEFYLFWELMLVPSYFMIAEWGYGNRERVSLKYFIYTHAGALSLLAGIIAIYVHLGTFDIDEIPLKLATSTVKTSTVKWILIALLIGFFVKMAVVPLHGWLPDAHAEAPTPISVLLSGVMIECGVYAIARICISCFKEYYAVFQPALFILAVISMYYGGIMALGQRDLKRLLAYSSISQMGYMLLGLSTATRIGVLGSIYHILAHACAKGLLFACAGVLIHQVGERAIDRLGGLAKRLPMTATVFGVSAFTLAGLPTLAAFISEILIFKGAIEKFGRGYYAWIVAIAILGAALTAAYILWTLRRVFFGPLKPRFKEAREAPLTMLAPLLVMVIVDFILGVYPRPFLNLIDKWAVTVFKP